MDAASFRKNGRMMVNYVADYLDTVGNNPRVVPPVKPGALADKLPRLAPARGESFEQIMHDVDAHVMPTVMHWMHPHFHSYFPAGNSFPSLIAEMLSDALGTVNFSWASNPASTELELVMVQWLGEMLGLPLEFLPFTPHGKGGGVIQSSATEGAFAAFMAARRQKVVKLRQAAGADEAAGDDEDARWVSGMVAYISTETHSSVQKVCQLVGMVKLRVLPTDERFRLRGDTLAAAIREDRKNGLEPMFACATLGSTSCCGIDALDEIGAVCAEEDIWLHVDATYGGAAFICPENRAHLRGIEHAMSMSVSPHKWLLVNIDCAMLWVKDRHLITNALTVDQLDLRHSWIGDSEAIDYRQWGLSTTRRFRALKLWFVIRSYGVEGLQRHVRQHIHLAQKFAEVMRADSRFDIVNEVVMGLVCFRLTSGNETTQELLDVLTASGRLYVVPSTLGEQLVIRWCVNAEQLTERQVLDAWRIIRRAADIIVAPVVDRASQELSDTRL